MDSHLLIQMVIASFAAVILYSFIGLIPGTDETSVLMPVSLALILGGITPLVVLTFFIAACVTLNLMNTMPTLIAGLPGGVLSAPMIEPALIIKKHGRTSVAIKKVAIASIIGVITSLVISIGIANLIAPYAETIGSYASWLFIGGAIFLSLIGNAKTISLISIVPLALLFQGIRFLYWEVGAVSPDKNITTSFFLGITVAPLILSLLSLLNKKELDKVTLTDIKNQPMLMLEKAPKKDKKKIQLKKNEGISAFISTALANFLFVLSPVGLILLFGEIVGKKEPDELKRAELTVTTMNALAQGTYLSGLLISIVALGIPLAPSAIGPGAAFFESPPVFKIGHSITQAYSQSQLIMAFIVGSCIALILVYFLATRFSEKLTLFVLKKVPHESLLALFIGLVLLLAYIDAGFINLFGVLLISLVCGTLNRLGVSYGVQFMSLYAAPFIIQMIS
ncbi:tripartite tricarboxylate transporter permease [Vagococcus carniphilus]|uniref:Tripartite tricarboxylate transporter permease n=1 Tax=Vagococcus carniphilus TaxID=218144 RepID=A0AAW8U3Z0_9ENTE|nr:tripartite tricarboxylate transporter permease [Vagococcus carniphilus]MDT2814105.1 tripartite tricarboxylate transporter permease [Vagococcus carniphilus]MDT2830332.1 tripartite tricarboxylate transporter permease [Vagococcus carniphilus]MDT2834253.1 tripartite tricarboxylate transporter permease [Vagococcus carniphilus]MDT2840099.1 tripartite tricarboxylate transporter permease [Vagococcus carniphilus]MDT2847912.1 tripartite tricarboxylate transporter permease [Vagococcus carniphilus]